MSTEDVRKRLAERPIEWFQDQSLRGLSVDNDPHAQRYHLLVTIQEDDHDLALALDVIEAAKRSVMVPHPCGGFTFDESALAEVRDALDAFEEGTT